MFWEIIGAILIACLIIAILSSRVAVKAEPLRLPG